MYFYTFLCKNFEELTYRNFKKNYVSATIHYFIKLTRLNVSADDSYFFQKMKCYFQQLKLHMRIKLRDLFWRLSYGVKCFCCTLCDLNTKYSYK